jgi:hypothetical protein
MSQGAIARKLAREQAIKTIQDEEMDGSLKNAQNSRVDEATTTQSSGSIGSTTPDIDHAIQPDLAIHEIHDPRGYAIQDPIQDPPLDVAIQDLPPYPPLRENGGSVLSALRSTLYVPRSESNTPAPRSESNTPAPPPPAPPPAPQSARKSEPRPPVKRGRSKDTGSNIEKIADPKNHP